MESSRKHVWGATMRYWRLGTGIELSRVGVGGYELGPHPDEPRDPNRAAQVLSVAAHAGVNWVDTSENYNATENETLIGEALQRLDDEFLVCSKVAPGDALTGGGSGFRPSQVRQACQDSLRRLRREQLDVYLLHLPDETGVPLDDTWRAMAELVDDGLTRTIGMSNYGLADIGRCHQQRPVDVVQTGLSLVDYLEDRDLVRQCGELGITVQIYEPLAFGILTSVPTSQVRDRWAGTVWEDTPFFERLLGPGQLERCQAVVDGIRPIAEKLQATIAQVAIAWVLHQPGVATAIAGSTSPEHTQDNAAAADLDLTDVLDELETLVPLGPTFA